MTSLFAILAALSAAFFFAVSDIFLKKALRFTSPTMAPIVTAPIQWILFTAFCLYFGVFAHLKGPALLWFMAAGLMNPVSFLFLYLLGIHRIGVTRAASLKGSSPIFSAIFAFAILAERLTGFQYLGIALAVGGIFVITSQGWEKGAFPLRRPARPPSAGGASAGEAASQKTGFIVSLLAGAATGVGAVVSKIALSITPSPLLGAWIGSSEAVLLFPLLALFFPAGERYRIRRSALRWLIPAGVAATAAVYSLILSIQLGKVSIVTTLYQTSPLMVLGLTALFLRRVERVSPRVVLGALLTVGGGVLVAVA